MHRVQQYLLRMSQHLVPSPRGAPDHLCGQTACRDLRSIGGLPTLLALLRAPDAGLRWRAADVLGTSAQNNSPVQQVCCMPSSGFRVLRLRCAACFRLVEQATHRIGLTKKGCARPGLVVQLRAARVLPCAAESQRVSAEAVTDHHGVDGMHSDAMSLDDMDQNLWSMATFEHSPQCHIQRKVFRISHYAAPSGCWRRA